MDSCKVSFNFSARELDDLGPLFGVIDDELAEVGRRACNWSGANFGKLRSELGIGQWIIEQKVDAVAYDRRFFS